MDRSTLTLGLVILAGGVVSFLWAGPNMDLVRSGWGQLAIALGGVEARQRAELWQTAYYGGVAGMVLGGILLLSGLIRPTAEGGPAER